MTRSKIFCSTLLFGVCCLLPVAVGWMDAPVLTAEAFAGEISLKEIGEEPGITPEFVVAYGVYLKARADDRTLMPGAPSYERAAEAFGKIAAATPDKQLKTRALWYEAFCRFLALQVKPAGEIAKKLPAPAPQRADVAGEKSQSAAMEKKLSAILDREVKTREMAARVKHEMFTPPEIDFPLALRRKVAVRIIAGLAERMALSPTRVMAKVDQALCASNLRQIGVAFHLYAQDHDGMFPKHIQRDKNGHTIRLWYKDLFPYTGDSRKWKDRGDVWRCPAIDCGGYSYGMNMRIFTLYVKRNKAKIPEPSKMMLSADSVCYKQDEYPNNPMYGGSAYQIKPRFYARRIHTALVDKSRHENGANILFADGHVEWKPAAEIPTSSSNVFWDGTNP